MRFPYSSWHTYRYMCHGMNCSMNNDNFPRMTLYK